MADEEKTIDTTIEETKETKTECPKCEECSCAGWKAGFGIFVALSVIMTIVAVVFLIKGNSIKTKIAEKAADVAQKVNDKSTAYVAKKEMQKRAPQSLAENEAAIKSKDAELATAQANLQKLEAEKTKLEADNEAFRLGQNPNASEADLSDTPVEGESSNMGGGCIFDSLKELSQKLFSHTEEQH